MVSVVESTLRHSESLENDRTLSALLAWKLETSRAISFLLRLMSLMQMQKYPCANSD